MKANSSPKNHHDLGLTDEEFLEVVDFFRELIRLDKKGKQKEKLVQVLRGQLNRLIHERRKALHDELKQLARF